MEVNFDLEAEVIESLVAGNTHRTLHGQIGKKMSGTIVTESDPTAKAFTSAATVAFTLADIAGSSDLVFTSPKVEYNKVGVASPADAQNPVRFSIGFEAEVPTGMQ